jgi:predicted transcriptional regulator
MNLVKGLIANQIGSKRYIERLLMLFYGPREWEHNFYYLDGIARDMRMEKAAVLRYLVKLEHIGVIRKRKAYPVYWETVRSEGLREGIACLMRS